jgi:hypothetical protein
MPLPQVKTNDYIKQTSAACVPVSPGRRATAACSSVYFHLLIDKTSSPRFCSKINIMGGPFDLIHFYEYYKYKIQ